MDWDPDAFPLCGCITGFTLPEEAVGIVQGVYMRRGYFDMFTAPMMAFSPPEVSGSHHPAPWLHIASTNATPASRVELRIEHDDAFLGLPASAVAWLLAALLRIRIEAPVRIPAVANIPLRQVADLPGGNALAFENGQHQNGLFRSMLEEATPEVLAWVSHAYPNALRLYHHDRFIRAFMVFDDASWSPRVELATTLIWTALEILFDKSAVQNKGKEIAKALAGFVGESPEDRDRVLNVVRDLYEKRGRIVHSGRRIDRPDFGQSLQLARAAFFNVLTSGELPPSHQTTKH